MSPLQVSFFNQKGFFFLRVLRFMGQGEY